MKLGLLRQLNPAYDAETWVRYEALYRGGKDFRAHVGKFLPKNPNEPDDRYKSRLEEARYRSYCGPIVDFFASQLMAAPLTIRCCDVESGDELATVDPFWTEFKEDADGHGTDLIDFARTVFRNALVKGATWVLAALPSDDDVEPQTKSDYDLRGLGNARVCHIQPESVLDWEYAEDGELAWAVVYEESSPRASFGESRKKIRCVWRVYDRSTVTLIEYIHDPERGPMQDDTEARIVSQEKHRFPGVPLVRVDLPRGLWLMNRIADAQIGHFRLSAGLAWAIKMTCYATPVFKMQGGSAGPGPAMGTGYFLTIGQQDDVTWVAPPAQPFGVVAEEAKSQKDEIYRVANQMALGVDNNAAAVGRSAQSKHADSSSTEICLVAYGAVVREAIEKVYDMLAAGRGEAVKFRIGGLDRFNLSDPTVAVDNATKAKALQVPSLTFRKELLMHTAEALMPSLSQDKKDAIRHEIEAGITDADLLREKADAEDVRVGEEPADESDGVAPGKKPAVKAEAKDEQA